MQSHHIAQNAWAEGNSIPGYSKKDAPTILLAQANHFIVNNEQNARRDARVNGGIPRWGSTARDEINYASQDLRKGGVSDKCKKKALKKSYLYLNSFGAL